MQFFIHLHANVCVKSLPTCPGAYCSFLQQVVDSERQTGFILFANNEDVSVNLDTGDGWRLCGRNVSTKVCAGFCVS